MSFMYIIFFKFICLCRFFYIGFDMFNVLYLGKVALDELGLDVDVYYACEIDSNATLVSSFHHGSMQLGNVLGLNTETVKQT